MAKKPTTTDTLDTPSMLPPTPPPAPAPAPTDPELVLLDPAARRRANSLTISIGNGQCVKARRLDMTTLVFEGLVPMPLLAAVQRMIAMPDSSPIEQFQAMGEADKTAMLDMLRRHAIAAVTVPKLSMTDTGDPTVLPVTDLTLTELMAIWEGSSLDAPMEPADASRFRERASTDDVAAVSPRQNVQPAAEPVGPRPVAVDIKHA